MSFSFPGMAKCSVTFLCRLTLLLGLSPAFLGIGLIGPVASIEPTRLNQLAQSQRPIDPRQEEADNLFRQGIRQYQTNQYDAALQSWLQALSLYRAINNRLQEGDALGNVGIAYAALGDQEKAIEYQQQRLAISRELKDRFGEGQGLGNLGVAYYQLGDYKKALDYHQQSLAIKREVKDRRGEGNSLYGLGNTYFALGDYKKALDYHQQSLAIKREIGDPFGEGEALNKLGNIYSALGDYSKAIEYQQQSLAIAQQLQDRRTEAAALGAMGIAYSNLGDYLKGIEYQQQSLKIKRDIKDQLGEASSLNNLGISYDLLGDYNKAIEFYQQGLVIQRAIKNRLGEGNVLNGLGSAYYRLGNYGKAIEAHQQSLVIQRQIKNRLGEGQSLGNLGNVYAALNDYEKAIEFYQQSLAISQELQDQLGESQMLGNLGNVYYKLGNYSKAVEAQQQNLAIARAIKHRLGEGVALNNLGSALLSSRKFAEAEQVLLEAIQVLESLRQGLSDTQKVSIADTQQSAYTNLQQVLIEQNKVERALEIAERGRARAFADLLAQRSQGKAQLTVQPIQIATIQQIAREQKATLVEYSNIDNKRLFIWVVQSTGAVAFREVDLEPLKQQKTSLDHVILMARCLGITHCETTVATRGIPPIAFDTDQGDRQFDQLPLTSEKNLHLQRLHQLLIAPISDLLNPNERVIFLPQGTQFLAPFAAFQDGQGQYLIEKYTIVVAPSIQVLQLTRQQRQRLGSSQGNRLVVGNPVMPAVSFAEGKPGQQLPSLPGAEQEAKEIAKLLKVPALIGPQATKAAVLKLMPTARLIHLATHGLLDDFGGRGIPGAIALAPAGADDGLLKADELLDLKLRAELVVLSACDTGQGKITGDGVIGLSRSLITAGVPSVIVSLWAVPDAPTAKLMTHFYRNLEQGQNKAQALRQAMLETKKDFPDPRAWAAFTLIGEAE